MMPLAEGGDPGTLNGVVEWLCASTGIVVHHSERLPGGEINASHRLRTSDGEMVLRLAPPRETELQVDRVSECAILRQVAAAGLAPAVVCCVPERHVLVTREIRPGAWSREQARSAAGIASVGRWLARLHALLPPAGCRVVDFQQVLAGYVATLSAHGAGDEVLTPLNTVAARGGSGPLEPAGAVLCHNDLHHLNIVGAVDAPLVIDWEYAGLGDARLDLAQFALVHQLDVSQCAELLQAYAAAGRRVPLAELRAAMDLAAAVNSAWQAVVRTAGALAG
jgi:aminoglycoside phosphotransferase (APT) family kinase protein